MQVGLGDSLSWHPVSLVISTEASASLSVKMHQICSKQFKQQIFAAQLTLKRTRVVQICDSEKPYNGNWPGVSQGVPEEEFSSFSSSLSPERNSCLQSSCAIRPFRSEMWQTSCRYKGTLPWRNLSSDLFFTTCTWCPGWERKKKRYSKSGKEIVQQLCSSGAN